MKRKLIIFGISFIVGWEAMGAIQEIIKWYKEHKKTEEKMNQLKEEMDKTVAKAILQEEEKMEEIKRQIEEQKKNDVFARELKSKINAANRIVEMCNQ